MNRAFFSLYVVLVLAIITLGWLTERIWRAYAPEDGIVKEKQQLLHMLMIVADKSSLDNARKSVQAYTVELDLDLSLYSLDDISGSSLREKIMRGNMVAINQSRSTTLYYQRIKDSNFVLSLTETNDDAKHSVFYRCLIFGFYFVIALVIYFWVWPLTRDLKRLQKSTTEVGLDGSEVEVKLGQRSVVSSLANAFNAMARRIRELLNSQKEMTHAISHELRTPLSRMKFALATFDIHKPEETLEQIQADITYMERMITEFLNYATFEARRERLNFQEGELLPLVDSIADRLKLSNITVENLLDDTHVKCEWYLIEHCIFNLLQNAERYGGKKIHVVLSIEGGWVSVAVEDDGHGIPEKEREKIFTAFYRAQTETKNVAGFGLGLALIRRIMQWHKGKVEVSTSTMGGAKFTLLWPH